MTSPLATQWQIGECRFDASSQEIERLGVRTRLPKRQAQLLLRLLSVAPEVVSRQSLLDDVWQRKFVEDDVLSRAIAELRRALGDASYIETIPKSGYRIISPVRPWADDATQLPLRNTALEITPGANTSAAPLSLPRGEADQDLRFALQNPTFESAKKPLWNRTTLLIISFALALLFFVIWLTRAHRSPPTRMIITAEDIAQSRPLTSAPGWEFAASVSAQAGLVAYVDELADETTLSSTGSAIFLSDLHGNSKRQMTARHPRHEWPSLSQDGTQLAFLRFDGKSCEVLLMRVLDLHTRRVASCAADARSAPAFSKDQKRLVFIAPGDSQFAASVAVMDLETGTIERLTTPSKSEGPDSNPKFVPGEFEVSFCRGRESERGLYAVSLTDRKIRTLVGGHNRIQGHAWTPSGAQVIYATDAPGYRALLALDLENQQTQVLGARGARYPNVSAAGDLVFDMAQFDANIWRVDLRAPDSAPIRTIASTRYDATPSLSPDGRRLAYVSNRNDGEQVFIANNDGSDEQLLHLSQAYRWTRPSFRPDGAALLMSTYSQTAEPEVHQYLFDSGRREQMRHLGSGADSAVYSSDGRQIIYKRTMSKGPTQLWIAGVDPNSPKHEIPGTSNVAQFRLIQDRVVLLRLGVNGTQGSFFEVPLAVNSRAKPRLLWADVALLSEYAFTVVGDHLYVVIDDGKTSNLWRMNMIEAMGTPPELVRRDVRADAVGTSIAISADEHWLWFARTDRLAIDLMIAPPGERSRINPPQSQKLVAPK